MHHHCNLSPGTQECCHTMPAVHPPFDRVRYHYLQLSCNSLQQLVNDPVMPLFIERPHVGLTAGQDVTYGLFPLPAYSTQRGCALAEYSMFVPVRKYCTILSRDHQPFSLCPESPRFSTLSGQRVN